MRYYSSQAVETSLTSSISNSATSMTVASITGYPNSTPFTVTLEQGTSNEEIVDVTGVSGTTWTIARGVDGSSGLAHSAGAKVVHTYTARDARESQTHQEATTGVHGLASGDEFVGAQATQTLTNKTLTSPTLVTPSLTSGGSWTGSPTLSSPTLETPTLNVPVIADYTSAQHDHSSATKGGAVPQSSVTGLNGRLGVIETKNADQDTTLADHGTRLGTVETNQTSLTSRVTALEGGVINGSFKFTPWSPARAVNSTSQSELTEMRQTLNFTGVTWPPRASRILVHAMFLQTGASDTRIGAKLNGTTFAYYGTRPLGAGTSFAASGELTYMIWDTGISNLAAGDNIFSYWAWKDATGDANWSITSARTWMTVL